MLWLRTVRQFPVMFCTRLVSWWWPESNLARLDLEAAKETAREEVGPSIDRMEKTTGIYDELELRCWPDVLEEARGGELREEGRRKSAEAGETM